MVVRIVRAGDAKDLFGVLSLPRTASEADIKRAFKKLSMKIHPDKCAHPQATAAFQRVSEAVAVLCDPTKRAAHEVAKTQAAAHAHTAAQQAAFRAAAAAAAARQAEYARAAAAQRASPAAVRQRMDRFAGGLRKDVLQRICGYLGLATNGYKNDVYFAYVVGHWPDPRRAPAPYRLALGARRGRNYER